MNKKSGWWFDLTGEWADLRELERITFPRPAELVAEGENYRVRLDLPADSDPREVLSTARRLITVVNGISRLYVGQWRNISCDGPIYVAEDGRRRLYLLPEPGEFRFRFGTVQMSVRRAGETEAAPQHEVTPSQRAVSAAEHQPSVEKVLRLLGGGELGFRDLYVIYEVIESDQGGLDALAATGWIARIDAKRFKHTANSVAVLGDQSRHGADKGDPPKTPLPLAEARTLIFRMTREWIDSKARIV